MRKQTVQRHREAAHAEGHRPERWIRRNKHRLGVRFCKLKGPLRFMCLRDSAFKAQDYQGLVMRVCIIMLAEAGLNPGGGSPLVMKTGQDVNCQV